MDYFSQQKIAENPKMAELLKQNSYWFKELNRNEDAYKDFIAAMKEKYHLRMTDKISNAIDNIDIITTILDTLK